MRRLPLRPIPVAGQHGQMLYRVRVLALQCLWLAWFGLLVSWSLTRNKSAAMQPSLFDRRLTSTKLIFNNYSWGNLRVWRLFEHRLARFRCLKADVPQLATAIFRQQ